MDGRFQHAAFYRASFAERAYRLPAGSWDFSATASFSEGDCGGKQHQLTTPVRITVTP